MSAKCKPYCRPNNEQEILACGRPSPRPTLSRFRSCPHLNLLPYLCVQPLWKSYTQKSGNVDPSTHHTHVYAPTCARKLSADPCAVWKQMHLGLLLPLSITLCMDGPILRLHPNLFAFLHRLFSLLTVSNPL